MNRASIDLHAAVGFTELTRDFHHPGAEFLGGSGILFERDLRKPTKADQSRKEQAMNKVNLAEKLASFSEHWKPKIVGELNGQMVKLVKFQGEFVWHKHDVEDELFLTVRGRFRMEFRDRHVWLEPGEFLIVPRGVEHRPVADEEAQVLLFEPASTLNTGNVRSERTVERLERI
jgi:mannose-6-phosphate isomerase-like protein (cupin superfamily)